MSTTPPFPETPSATPLPPGTVPNHLVWAIVSTIFSLCFCCGIPGLFTGIAAIVFSTKVNAALRLGDIDAAKRASDTGKILCWITTALAAIGLLWTIYSMTMGDGMQQYQMLMEQIQQAQ